jgi:hypothetical protein
MITVSMWVFSGSLIILTVYRLGDLYDLRLLSPYVWISYFFLFFLTTLSVSITIFASAKVAILLKKAPYLNIVGLIFILLFQYSLIMFWYPAMETVRTEIIVGFTEANVFGFLTHFSHNINIMFLSSIKESVKSFPFPSLIWPIYLAPNYQTLLNPSYTLFITALSDYLVTSIYLLRVVIAIIFIIAFLLQTVQRPIMTLWARIIESDKPVFTLLFGGIAGFAKICQWIGKIF